MDSRTDAAKCEAALEAVRRRARALLKQSRLDEAQVVIIEKRVEELGRMLRLSVVDERFRFLPMGMVETLRAILEDSHVSALEHRHFLSALEAEATLSAEQKTRVKALIDTWFASDAGGTGTR